MKQVYDYVDSKKGRFISELQTVVRQPSVSAQEKGVRGCAELLASMMEKRGVKASIMETDWNPIVFGHYDSGADRTLLIYNHYDVQPPEPLEDWRSPPFAAEIHDDRMIGRGTTDSKGNLMAHLEALEAYKESVGEAPVNLKFLFDGEEESGSPSLPKFVKQNLQLLNADAALSFDGGFTARDRPTLSLGSSGLLYVKLDVEAASKDLHSGRARLVPSAAWRLVWALESIKDSDGRIAIPGFYDKVKAPTQEQRRFLEEAPWNDDEQREALGLVGKPFLGDVRGTDALQKLLFTPTCNICGMLSGYTGAGSKTVLPHRASAKLDFRLVASQDPHRIFDGLVEHLKQQGFDDVKAEKVSFSEPAISDPNSDIVKSVILASEEIYGFRPMVKPTDEASGRQGNWLGGQLDIPSASTGIGPPDWLGHAANEFITIPHYINGIKFAAAIWRKFGEKP